MEEEEATRKRKMSREPQADTELSTGPREDKSQQQNLVGEAAVSGSTAQESIGQEKPRRSLTRTGCKRRSQGSEEERPTLGQEGGQSSELGVHEQLHYGEKPHKCSMCEKSFRWRFCLTRHFVIHTGGTALRVWGVREELQPELPPDCPPEDPHRGEALRV
ncbi:zinc finger protein 48-like isoform X1 [Prinia subflava]|uniref:zinc finger protein 48-like isoform X1 n=1 Tax=Prinia subflava TaxID=208062 RepID=UPI002FE0A79E